jgi:hypothetical protein
VTEEEEAPRLELSDGSHVSQSDIGVMKNHLMLFAGKQLIYSNIPWVRKYYLQRDVSIMNIKTGTYPIVRL